MGRDCEPDSEQHPSESSPHALSAWAMAVLTLALILLGIFAIPRALPPDGIASGPWQAALIEGLPHMRVGFLTGLIAGAYSEWPTAAALAGLNGLSALFMVLACGLLAGIAMGISRTVLSRWGAAIAGITAFGVAGTLPLTEYAGSAAAPTSLTLMLAVGALAVFLCVWDRESNYAGLVMAGFLSSLAAMNLPSMGILIPVFILASLFRPGDGLRQAMRPAAVAAGAAVGLTIPAAMALLQGATVIGLLQHMLESPYPTLMVTRPAFDIFSTVWEQLGWLLLLLPALVGVLLVPRLRKPAMLILVLAACFGPFLPLLAHDPGELGARFDTAAPQVFVLFLVALMVALSLAWALDRLIAVPRRGMWIVNGGLAAVIVLGLGFASDRPDMTRRHGLSRMLGEAMLGNCASDSVLVMGDPALFSMARMTQAAREYRTDIQILPIDVLWEPPYRRAFGYQDTQISIQFPDSDSEEANWETWRREQPMLLERQIDDIQRRHEAGHRLDAPFYDLMVWDFIRDNVNQMTLYFAGFHPDWLMARVHESGGVVGFPSESDPPTNTLDVLLNLAQTIDHEGVVDPDGFEALTRLLIPHWVAARKQNRMEDAHAYGQQTMALAELGTTFPVDLRQEILRQHARTAARMGDAETAADWAAQRVMLLGDAPDPHDIRSEITHDLALHEQTRRFWELLQKERRSENETAELQELEEGLWRGYEFAFLVEAYREKLRAAPRDPETLYQYAAALTQLGETEVAWMALIDALERAPTQVMQSIYEDGRFVLLRLSQDDR